MPSSLGRRLALAASAFALFALAAVALCARGAEGESSRSVEPPAPRSRATPTLATSAGNEPVAVRLNGREVRVRCELACDPLGDELGRLFDGCRADPLRAPHLVSAGGVSLAGLGCCTEAEEAYRQACGFDGDLSRCGTEWAARCARGAT